jgi:hypothetical protein
MRGAWADSRLLANVGRAPRRRSCLVGTKAAALPVNDRRGRVFAIDA